MSRRALSWLLAPLALLAAPAAFAADGHIDPASRAHRHSLSMARHAATTFQSSTAQSGLRSATQGIQKCDSQVTADQDVACQVTVESAGSLGTFGTVGDGLDLILTQADYNAVILNTASYAKVVSAISWCGGPAPSGFTILGCAPRGGSSLIIATMTNSGLAGQVLFHELGHNKGLDHRGPEFTDPLVGRPLMAPNVSADFLELNLRECSAFHAGGVDVGPKRPVDIGFIVDDTGSMSEEIGGVRDALTRVIDAAAGSGSSCDAFQLTTFKDNVTPRDPTTNLSAIRTQVSNLVSSGGGECPEASVEAILATEPSLKNNGRAFIFTDASPYAGADLAGAVSRLRARGIRIDALVTGDCLATLSGESATGVLASENRDGSSSLALAGSTVSAVEAYSFLTAQTGGSLIFQPGVNTGNPQDVTRFENAVFNVVQGALTQSVSSVEPAKGPRSGQLGITVRGSKTNFLPGSTLTVSGAEGVHVYDVTAVSPVELRATLSISNTTALGFRDVEVRTPLGGGAVEIARGVGAIEIVPSPSGATVVGISPSVAAQGSTVDVRISGRNTNFGASSLLSLGTGVSVESILSADSDLLRARVRIAANAPVGFRDVRVTTGAQVALENEIGPFFVTSPGPAIARIVTVSPNTGAPGTEVTLTIDGENTHFLAGASRVEIGGDGIEIISQSVSSSTRITARISVAASASQGFRDVRVVTGDETAAILGGFRVASGGGACVANDSTLCLGNGRFRVQASWRDFTGNSGTGKVVPGGSADSGIFWFFNSSNWELLIKVLDGCSLNDRFWVFAAATTNVEFSISVTDTTTGAAKTYFNPLGHRADSITDTAALDVCGDGAAAGVESLVSLDRPDDHPGLAVSGEKMDQALFAALVPSPALAGSAPAKSDAKLGLEPGAAVLDRACVTQTISCNSTRTGFLTADDCPLDDGTVFDLFTFEAAAGTDIVARLTSLDFDTFLFLLDPQPVVVETDDDGGTGTNSQISYRLDQTGTWALAPNNFFPGDIGAYSLSLTCSGAPPPPPPVPLAPANLTASPVSASRIDLSWNDRSNNETEFRIEGRAGASGSFNDIGGVPANSTGAQVTGLTAGTAYQFRVRARNASGSSDYSNIASASTQGGGGGGVCSPGANTLCLNRSRFKVEVNWKNPEGATGRGQVAPLGSADSGIFWFFTANNWEMLIKVLDGCAINNRYWVYGAATTTVEYDLVVTDTQTGTSRVYSNPAGQPATTILDAEAFASCP